MLFFSKCHQGVARTLYTGMPVEARPFPRARLNPVLGGCNRGKQEAGQQGMAGGQGNLPHALGRFAPPATIRAPPPRPDAPSGVGA